MSTQVQPRLTLADLDALPDDGKRYELIEGDLYVSRAPHLTHQAVIGNLYHSLRGYLNTNPLGKVFPEVGLVLSDQDAVIPDLVFVTHERFARAYSDGRFVEVPELVVEVISSGAENERRDRNVKRHLYGKFGADEYWIINREAVTVEVYRRGASGLELRATLGGQDVLTSPLLPGFSCPVESIFEV